MTMIVHTIDKQILMHNFHSMSIIVFSFQLAMKFEIVSRSDPAPVSRGELRKLGEWNEKGGERKSGI